MVLVAVSQVAAVDATLVVQAVAALVFTIAAARRSRLQPRRGWVALAVFGAVWFVSRAGALAMGPDPTLAGLGRSLDLIWVVGVPCGLFGIYRQAFGGIAGRTAVRVVSDALVVALALMLVAWVAFHQVTLGGREPLPALRLVVPALELLGASLLLTAAVYQPARHHLRWWVAASFAAVAGDVSLAHQVMTGRPVGGPVVLACFVLTPLLLVGMVLTPDASEDQIEPDRYGVTSAHRELLYLPAALALAAGFWEVVEHRGLYGLSGVLGMLLGLAVMVNHWLASRESSEVLQDLARSRRRYEVTFDQAPIGIVVTDAAGVLLQANASLGDVVGVPVDRLIGSSGQYLLSAEDQARRDDLRARMVAGNRSPNVQEVVVRRPDGTTRWARVKVSPLELEAEVGFVGVVEDVTDRRTAQERLEYLARHDPLTGLASRSVLADRIEEVVDVATPELPAAVLIADLDQFKLVNDSMGHAAGDRLLVECARRIASVVGERGLVTRFGGDEYAVVLDPAPVEEHTATALCVRDAVRGRVPLPEGDTFPTVSIGVVLTRNGVGREQLVAEADAALYRAKERGRNRVEWYGSTEIARARSDHRLLGELNRALERRELRVFHQPVVDVTTGRTVGTEALVRWQHPDLGLLAPGAFLPLAETSGLMSAIGRHVLAEACATAAAWPILPGHPAPLSVSVNLAVQQLLEPDFVDEVGTILAETGLDPRRLWLEITESALMSDVRTSGRTLAGLRNLGVHLSVDDFGTGYSSLTYLKRFPVEALKIDRSFVDGLGVDHDDTTIVSALVGLGRRLGLKVVAEGVETPLQLQLLEDLRCDFAQGYLFGRPVPAEVFAGGFAALAYPSTTPASAVPPVVAAGQPAAAEPSNATGSPGWG
jgi:diguanylate cyclase (GGDEF)-like protein/PAS domain S-box-containing protein